MPKLNDTSAKKITSTTLLIPLISITSLVLGVVVYNYFLDKQKETNQLRSVTQNVVTQEFDYKLIDGSIYKVTGTENTIVVDKEDLPDSLYDISTIISFSFSPDGSKILVSAEGGLSFPILFYKNIENQNIVHIGPGTDPIWSKNSLYIAYKRAGSDIGPYHAQVYDTSADKEIVLTTTTDFQNTTFNKFIWADDSKSLQAEYLQYDAYPNGKVIKKGFEKITVIN